MRETGKITVYFTVNLTRTVQCTCKNINTVSSLTRVCAYLLAIVSQTVSFMNPHRSFCSYSIDHLTLGGGLLAVGGDK